MAQVNDAPRPMKSGQVQKTPKIAQKKKAAKNKNNFEKYLSATPVPDGTDATREGADRSLINDKSTESSGLTGSEEEDSQINMAKFANDSMQLDNSGYRAQEQPQQFEVVNEMIEPSQQQNVKMHQQQEQSHENNILIEEQRPITGIP